MVKKERIKRKPGITVYEKDNSGLKGKAIDFFKPENLQELKSLIRQNDKICVRGGGTGFVGGCIPQNDIVIDTLKLKKISDINIERRSVEVEVGVTIHELNEFLADLGLEFPVKIASEKMATIGGIIATNTAGIRKAKYGELAEWVNWIEVIDSAGNATKVSRIDFRDYSGMEGITGVISRANLRVINKVKRSIGIFSHDYLHEIINKFQQLRLNSNVSAVELIDKKLSEMLGLPFKYHLIIEYDSEEGEFKGEEYLEKMNLLFLVYHILLNKEKRYRIEDFKVFSNKFDSIFTYIESFDIPVFASLPSGILHPCFSAENLDKLNEIVSVVKRYGGRINGSFGIGLLKKQFLDINDKRLLVNMKKRLDPYNKFNSGKIVD